LDGFWETKLAPWDLAAGTLIVTEAGGMVTNLSGGKFDINSGYVLATNGLIHRQTIDCLSKVKEKLQGAGIQA
jgi:myo-inositol-1(or 4)-monophosphatase